MTSDEAKATLYIHSGLVVSDQKLGLIGRLRPYQGLDESDFADIIEAIINLYEIIKLNTFIDRSIVASLWWICDRSRILVLNQQSSARTNNLVEDRDIVKLSSWINVIESLSNRMLQGGDLQIAMANLLEYLVKECEVAYLFRNIKFAVDKCVVYEDSDIAESAKRAILCMTSGNG